MEIDWDRIAPIYEWQVPFERTAVRKLVELLDVGPDDSVLDVASGTGAVLRELARLDWPPRRATGIDSSAGMLKRAWGLPRSWELRRGEATELPFEDRSFDVVTASYLLHLLDPGKRRSVLSEIARVLRPGGRVGVVTVAETGPISRRILGPIAARAERRGGTLCGLVPLDPRAELVACGFEPGRATRVWSGYPSLCVVALKPQSQ